MQDKKFISYNGERYCKRALYDGLDAVMQKRHIAHNEGHLLYLVYSDLKEYPGKGFNHISLQYLFTRFADYSCDSIKYSLCHEWSMPQFENDFITFFAVRFI